jgi:putative nucleotidyltransferase with HDIG domain
MERDRLSVVKHRAGVAFSVTGLALALGAAAVLVHLGGTQSVAVHLFYLPIIYAAFVFGDYGAMLIAVISALACANFTPAGFTQDGSPIAQPPMEILVRAAVYYVVAVVSSRAFTELRRRIAEQRTLYEVAANISSTLRIRNVLDLIAHHALKVMEVKGCSIRLLEVRTDELRLAATAGLSDDYWEKGPVHGSDSPVDRSVLQGEIVEIYNAVTDDRFLYRDAAREAGITSVLVVPLRAKERVIGLIRVYARRPRHFRVREVELLSAFADQASVAIENAQLYEDIRRNYYETVRALTRAIEAKDLATFSHSERVTELVDHMANEIGMPPEQRELLRFGTILHDVGKIGVAEESLEARDPRDAEAIFYQMHPLIGQSILKPISFLESVIPVVVYHHERWDGSGFPEGRVGKDIPEMARMVAVADVYDRLRHSANGNGAPGLSPREALEQITSEAGSRFDPELVRVFRRIMLLQAGTSEEPDTSPHAPMWEGEA